MIINYRYIINGRLFHLLINKINDILIVIINKKYSYHTIINFYNYEFRVLFINKYTIYQS